MINNNVSHCINRKNLVRQGRMYTPIPISIKLINRIKICRLLNITLNPVSKLCLSGYIVFRYFPVHVKKYRLDNPINR